MLGIELAENAGEVLAVDEALSEHLADSAALDFSVQVSVDGASHVMTTGQPLLVQAQVIDPDYQVATDYSVKVGLFSGAH